MRTSTTKYDDMIIWSSWTERSRPSQLSHAPPQRNSAFQKLPLHHTWVPRRADASSDGLILAPSVGRERAEELNGLLPTAFPSHLAYKEKQS
jgi:hypothetical protein